MYSILKMIEDPSRAWLLLIAFAIWVVITYLNPLARERRAERGKCLLYIPFFSWAKTAIICAAVLHVLVVLVMLGLKFFVHMELASVVWVVYAASLGLLWYLLWYGYYVSCFRLYQTGLFRGRYDWYLWTNMLDWERVADNKVLLHGDYASGVREITVHHHPQLKEQLDALLDQYIIPHEDESLDDAMLWSDEE